MRRFIGLVLIVVLLLIAADRLAWWGAERGVAAAIQDSQHLARRPEVSITGFPFLTQALRGTYDEVDGTIHDLTVENGVTVDELDLRLRGVHVDLSDLLRGRVTSAPVDTASAQALVGFTALDVAAAANLHDDRLSVRFGPGRGGLLSITGRYRTPVLTAQVRGQARLTTRDGGLVVRLAPQSFGNLPKLLRSQVVSQLSGSYRLPDLPFGFQARSVRVGPDGVRVSATARSVELGSAASG